MTRSVEPSPGTAVPAARRTIAVPPPRPVGPREGLRPHGVGRNGGGCASPAPRRLRQRQAVTGSAGPSSPLSPMRPSIQYPDGHTSPSLHRSARSAQVARPLPSAVRAITLGAGSPTPPLRQPPPPRPPPSSPPRFPPPPPSPP